MLSGIPASISGVERRLASLADLQALDGGLVQERVAPAVPTEVHRFRPSTSSP
jgi:hypothetical protein